MKKTLLLGICTIMFLNINVSVANSTVINSRNIIKEGNEVIEFVDFLMEEGKNYDYIGDSTLPSKSIYIENEENGTLYDITWKVNYYYYQPWVNLKKIDGYFNLKESFRISVKNSSQVIRLPKLLAERLVEVDEPAVYNYKLEKGQSYIIDVREGAIDFSTNFLGYELGCLIRTNKATGEIKIVTGDDVNLHNIYSSEIVKFQCDKDNLEINLPYAYKDYINKFNLPVYEKISVDINSQIRLKNTYKSNVEIKAFNFASMEYSEGFKDILNCSFKIKGSKTLKPGENISLAFDGNSYDTGYVYIPYELKENLEIINEPLFVKKYIRTRQMYQIDYDSTDKSNKIPINIVSYYNKPTLTEHRKYNSKGELDYVNRMGGQITMNNGEVIKFLPYGEELSIYYPYGFEVSLSEIDDFSIIYGEVISEEYEPYIKTNNTDEVIEILVKGYSTSSICDIEITDERNNKVNLEVIDSHKIKLMPGSSIKVNVREGSNYFNLFDTKEYGFKINDVNRDETVNITDLSQITSRYNISESKLGNNTRYDINTDGKIDLYDIVSIAKEIQ